MPEMEEGSILYMPTTLPGLPSKEAGWILQQMDKKLKAFPEVERVFGKLGRADTATDPAPVEMIETTVTLKPRSQWREGMTKDKLIAEMNQAMQIVGYVNSWTQPINTRVMMQDTGIQTPVGIKIKGPDLVTVGEMAQNVETLLKDFPGTQAVIAERIARGYFVDARLDLERMAAHGRHRRRSDAHHPVRHRRRQRDRHPPGGQDGRAAGRPIFARVRGHARQGEEHTGHHGRRPLGASGG